MRRTFVQSNFQRVFFGWCFIGCGGFRVRRQLLTVFSRGIPKVETESTGCCGRRNY